MTVYKPGHRKFTKTDDKQITQLEVVIPRAHENLKKARCTFLCLLGKVRLSQIIIQSLFFGHFLCYGNPEYGKSTEYTDICPSLLASYAVKSCRNRRTSKGLRLQIYGLVSALQCLLATSCGRRRESINPCQFILLLGPKVGLK